MKQIVFDTNIVRSLCQDERIPNWWNTFVNMRNDGGWTFHLSDVCFLELVMARERDSIKDKEWERGIALLRQVIGNNFPCLPGQRDLFHLCGFKDVDDTGEFSSTQFLLKYSQAVWRFLSHYKKSDWKSPISFWHSNKIYHFNFQPGGADGIARQEAETYSKYYSETPVSLPGSYDEQVSEIKKGFDSWALQLGSAMPLSVRGDILAHAQLARWNAVKLRKYHPDLRRRKNDGVDSLLMFTFLWPALLVSSQS